MCQVVLQTSCTTTQRRRNEMKDIAGGHPGSGPERRSGTHWNVADMRNEFGTEEEEDPFQGTEWMNEWGRGWACPYVGNLISWRWICDEQGLLMDGDMNYLFGAHEFVIIWHLQTNLVRQSRRDSITGCGRKSFLQRLLCSAPFTGIHVVSCRVSGVSQLGSHS